MGGAVTVTDKRIIRYFMTTQKHHSLYFKVELWQIMESFLYWIWDQPVKIMDLAENMIRLSGVQGIEIVETGLRPGEKLYEELLVKTEELDKTSNSMIFIERDSALSPEEINTRLNMLREVCETGDDSQAREVLRKAVPTFKKPEEVNRAAEFVVHQKKSEPEREEAVAI